MASNKSQVNNLFAGLNKVSNTDKISKAESPKKVDMRDLDEDDIVIKEDVIISEKTPSEVDITSNLEHISEQIYRTKDYSIFLPYPKEELRLALHTGEQRKSLKDSIEKHGITTPIKVSPISDGKFVILGGHNRLDIAKELGIEVPYMVLSNLKEDEQDEIVAEEHILNRQQADLKPSQMMKLLKAIRKTSTNQKELIERASLSKTSIYRFLSFENLIEDVLYNLVDTQKLSLNSASGLSSFSKKAQQNFLDYTKKKQLRSISEKPMKKLLAHEENEWDESLFDSIFINDSKKVRTYKIEFTDQELLQYLNDTETDDLKNIILDLLKTYKSNK